MALFRLGLSTRNQSGNFSSTNNTLEMRMNHETRALCRFKQDRRNQNDNIQNLIEEVDVTSLAVSLILSNGRLETSPNSIVPIFSTRQKTIILRNIYPGK